jgi:hypothetical protein
MSGMDVATSTRSSSVRGGRMLPACLFLLIGVLCKIPNTLLNLSLLAAGKLQMSLSLRAVVLQTLHLWLKLFMATAHLTADRYWH